MNSITRPRHTSTRRRIAVLALVGGIALAACGDDTSDADVGQPAPQSTTTLVEPSDSSEAPDDVVRLWIEPDLADCQGEALQQCMQIATSPDGPTELFYDAIVGYDHEEGTAAVVDVTITEVDDPPADGSSLLYTLVEIVEQGTPDDG